MIQRNAHAKRLVQDAWLDWQSANPERKHYIDATWLSNRYEASADLQMTFKTVGIFVFAVTHAV